MLKEAISAFEKLLVLSGESPFAIGCLGYAYAISGKPEKALQMLARLDELSGEKYVSPFWRAIIYFGLGEKNKTYELLDKAYQERESFLLFLKYWPKFDSLRSEQRFIDLLKKIGF